MKRIWRRICALTIVAAVCFSISATAFAVKAPSREKALYFITLMSKKGNSTSIAVDPNKKIPIPIYQKVNNNASKSARSNDIVQTATL